MPHGRLVSAPVPSLLLAGLLAAFPGNAALANACEPDPGTARSVARIVDAETIVLDDATEVRLIGALAPRPEDAGIGGSGWPPEHAAKAALEQAALGKTVELSFAGRRSDRYGRILAHVFVREGGQRLWLQEHLLRTGHARVYSLPGNADCLSELLAAEQAARAAEIGLWGYAAYRIKPAAEARALLRYRNTFQVVEGRIVAAADVRGQMFLNFGTDWRTDFTASARPRARRAIEQTGLDLKSLEGRTVRIRGWIERRSGPAIELHHPSQIEIVAE